MGKSQAQIVADLPAEEQAEILEGVDPQELLYDWGFWGRPEQHEPEGGSWTIWAIVAGRGHGKTRSGAEWIRDKARTPNTRIALVGRTSADTRQVIVQGESGIMNVCPPSEMPEYKASVRELHWPNGSIATTFTAAEPDQLRGPQFHVAWCDEMAAWNHIPGVDGLTSWGNVQVATRLPRDERNKILVTTTPKRVPAMKELLQREGKDTVITRGSTLENAGNLGPSYIDFIFGMYAGSRLEQQELYGVLLDAVEGALWTDEIIDHVNAVPMGMLKVIAVDPSVASEPTDECGIVVAGCTPHKTLTNRHAYVLEDASVHGAPEVWAKAVVKTWEHWRCPVIAEVNQGGALVKSMIHSINPAIPVIEVRARVGKALRAEPVTLKYDQGRVHHLGWLGELEAQMTSWVPGETRKSPDRVDALVYAITGLLVNPPKALGGGAVRAKSSANRTLPRMHRRRSGLLVPDGRLR